MPKAVKEASFDAEVGRKAFEKLLPFMQQIPADQVIPATARVNLAATFVVGILGELGEPELKEQILSMPTLRKQAFTDLGDIAWAAWYSWTKWQDASALKSGVKVPPALLEQATARRARMMAVLNYYLSEDPAVERALDDIRRGSGYQDTASDLVRLSRLYEEHQRVISADTKHYQAEDAQEAQNDAGAIVQALSAAQQNKQEWSDRRARAWTLLNQAYKEVTAAIFWLRRDEPEIAAEYPSLYVVARPGGARRRKSNGEAADDEGEAEAQSA